MTTLATATVQKDKDTGELYIEIPQDVLIELDWTTNTELEWQQIDNDRWSIQKVKTTQ